jgi:hypothetical protein
MRSEIEREKQIQKNDELSSLIHRRRKPGSITQLINSLNSLCSLDQDYLQVENEYLIQQKTTLSNSTTLNEMLTFKKALEKSEQKREQLSDHLEVLLVHLQSD